MTRRAKMIARCNRWSERQIALEDARSHWPNMTEVTYIPTFTRQAHVPMEAVYRRSVSLRALDRALACAI